MPRSAPGGASKVARRKRPPAGTSRRKASASSGHPPAERSKASASSGHPAGKPRGQASAPRASRRRKARRASPTPVQLALPRTKGRGGARPGAGRKPNGPRAGVSHLARPRLSRHHPVHVTLRVKQDVPGLRTKRTGRLIFAAFAVACERFGARLTHFSIQHNHLHLLVEANGAQALSRALQGLAIRLAKRLNRLHDRRGAVFADRYHARALRSPLEVRRAVLYVINNYRRHLAQVGEQPPRDWADPFSSVDYFDGFKRLPGGRTPRAEFALGRDPPVSRARTWLLGAGWRRRGLIDVAECPRG